MKKTKYILTAACGLLLTGCSGFLEEYSQDTYYVQSYNDLDELLIGECYMQTKNSVDVNSTSREPGYFIHFLADEIEEQNSAYDNENNEFDLKTAIFGYYTWQQRPGQNEDYTGFLAENESWTAVYKAINVANNIIASVKDVPNNTADEKEGVMRVNGEAHFLRGLYYFWLVNLYAKPYNAETSATDPGVPLKTSEVVEDKKFQRNTVKEVYDQVLSDLNVAHDCLSKTPKKNTIYRADSTAVNLLLSRVYLYMQNWQKAKEYADRVLSVRSTLTDINSMSPYGGFLSASSKETLFSMGGTHVTKNLSYKYQSFRVAHDFYNSYADNDLRKSQWYWTGGDFIGVTKIAGADGYDPSRKDYYGNAYGYYLSGKQEVSDRFLFRTAEAYLNKAEAEACLGDEAGARTTLNQLREKRFKSGSDYEVKSSGKELMDAIREERAHELAFEGHRWFDLRRYMVCEKYPESKQIVHPYTYYVNRSSHVMTTTHVFTLKENDPAYTLPIPHEVTEFNTGMAQNERPWRDYTVTDPNKK